MHCSATDTRHHTSPIIISAAMRSIYANAAKLAATNLSVVILGETGTGKDVIARRIHALSERAFKPLTVVNCGAIPSQLIESTLFGHNRGSFTGAYSKEVGIFESTCGGTVFLDEIGELPMHCQAALLRVLDTNKIRPIGSPSEHPVDTRIIAATNQNLDEMCQHQRFRPDLLFRLSGFTIKLPPLRRRTEEILPLAYFFLSEENANRNEPIASIGRPAELALKDYPWPGNVRELKNAISQAAALCDGATISCEHLPDRVCNHGYRAGGHGPRGPNPELQSERVDLRTIVGNYEAELIRKTLGNTNWNRTLAAEQLGLPVRTLSYKMRQHGISNSA